MKLLSKALALLLLLPVSGLPALAQPGAVTTAVQSNQPTLLNNDGSINAGAANGTNGTNSVNGSNAANPANTSNTSNGSASVQRQNLPALRKIAEEFIKVQTAGLSGTVNIAVDAVDSRLNLPACAVPQAFLPNGGRLWGRTTIGVRCAAPSVWTIYIPASVQVMANYIAARTPLAPGQTIGPGDVTKMQGDLSSLPSGIITDESQAIGRVANLSMAAGTPLRQDALRSNRVVQQGQAVRIISNGTGFQITVEGRAMNNASEGQMIQAKTATGQVVSGVARAGGIVEINY